jgi:FtsZ-binding cell division protein ZapB
MASIKRDPFLTAVDRLESVVTESPAANAGWAEQVRSAIGVFQKALTTHESATEAPNGALSILNSSKQDTAPILDRKVQQFRFEHQQFIERTRALLKQVDAIGTRPPGPGSTRLIEEFHESARELVDGARSHQEAEENLMHASVMQETGVGD